MMLYWNSNYRHQMAASFTIDMREFHPAARALVDQTKKDTGVTLKRIAKNLVQDCVKFTPPFSEATSQESFAVQRKVGIEAVTSDVTGMFRPAGEFDFDNNRRTLLDYIETGSTFFGLPENDGLKRRALNYIQAGNWDAIQRIFENTHQRLSKFIASATSEIHKSARDRRGRVRRSAKTRPYYVQDARSIKRLLRTTIANVGIAKSGWNKAARRLGLTLPNWIAKHRGRGLYKDTVGHLFTWPSITVGNLVEYIQATGASLRIMQRAVDNRVRNMKKELEITLQKVADRANKKAAAKALVR